MIRLMVSDDEPDVIDLFNTYFDDDAIEVIGAYSAQDAIDKVEHAEIDVIVTDIIMPGQKDGLDVIVEIKESHPEVKILAMTGFYDSKQKKGFLQAAEALGADAVFYKPLSLRELHDKVLELVEAKKSA